jgi:uncharacterized protein involved in outer membrane biogenesis
MRRVALIILGIATGLTALILLAVAIAVATFDPRSLVAPVQARIKAATGRDLAVNGPIDLKVSLEPRIVVSDVSLGNAPWGKAPDMVHARRVEVRVALLPLMSRRFEVVELALFEPVIALETDAQGRGNWDFGLTPATPVSQPAGAAAAALAGAGAFGIANLSVDNGALTYRDGVTGQTTRVTIERLSARSRGGDAPVEAEFRGKVNDVAVSLAGNLGPVDALRAGRWPYPVAAKGETAESRRSLDQVRRGRRRGRWTTSTSLGAFAAKGQATVAKAGAGPAPTASGGALRSADSVLHGGRAAKPAPSRMIFSDTTWSFDALQNIDAEGRVSIAGLALDKGVKLTDVSAMLALREGKLDVTEIRSRLFDGTLNGHLSLDTKHTPPALTLKLDGENLSLALILEAAGTRREIRGGRTTLAIDVAARGASPHAWAASTSGIVVATVGQTTLVNTKLDLDNALDRLVQAVNPFRERDPSTELKCAVIRLPLSGGIAQIDRSIAFETQKLRVYRQRHDRFQDRNATLALRTRIRKGFRSTSRNFGSRALQRAVRTSGRVDRCRRGRHGARQDRRRDRHERLEHRRHVASSAGDRRRRCLRDRARARVGRASTCGETFCAPDGTAATCRRSRQGVGKALRPLASGLHPPYRHAPVQSITTAMIRRRAILSIWRRLSANSVATSLSRRRVSSAIIPVRS